jgi:sulfonate transport system substrate-binding protein
LHHHVHRARPVAFLFLLLALLAAACGSDAKGPTAAADTTDSTTAPADLDLSGVTLRVGDLGGTQQAGLEAAGESDTPYKIEWSQFPSGPPAVEAINAGAVDIAIMGDTPPIFAAAGGVDTKVVAVARPKDGNQPYLQILVPEGSDIQSVADLKGKTVAVAQQTILEYFLRRALQKEGLDIGDVKPAYLQPADGQAAYSSGKADAFVSIEPLTTITNSAKKSRAIANSADYFISQTFAVARGKALDDPKVSAALGDYLQRTVRTYQWEQDHIEEWVPIYVKTTKFPQGLAAATIASTAVAWQPIDDDVFQVQQDQIDTWAEAGAVPSGLKAEDEFDTRFNTLIKEVAK